jgi:hypothetical protein
MCQHADTCGHHHLAKGILILGGVALLAAAAYAITRYSSFDAENLVLVLSEDEV